VSFLSSRPLSLVRLFNSYFDRLVTSPSDQPFLVGNKLSYADLTLWNIVEGLKFAFPNATARELPSYKGVQAVYESFVYLSSS
jgi:glutathione S-transferase